GGVAGLQLQRERLDQDRAVGAVPAAAGGEVDLRRPRQGQEALLGGAVGPEWGVDRVGDQPRRRAVLPHPGAQPRLAQARGELRPLHLLRRLLQAVVAAAVVGDQQLAFGVEAEARYLERGAGQLLVPGDLAALVADAPDLARGPVAVDVGP